MPPFSEPSASLGFTSSLMDTLRTSRLKLDSYIQDQKSSVDAAATAHQAKVRQEQTSIDQQVENLLALQQERGLASKNASNPEGLMQRKTELASQQNHLKEEIAKLEAEHSKRERTLEALQKEEAKHRARAKEVRNTKKKIEEVKNITVEDLTRGIVNYKYLGLDFEKAGGNRLRFTFTQLDAAEPLRAFSFVLSVSEEDIYEIDCCEPAIHDETLLKIMNNVNSDDDLSSFIRSMRKAFSETL